MSFENRIAVITGGTQGLGQAVAELFAKKGAAGIVIVGRIPSHPLSMLAFNAWAGRLRPVEG